MLAHPVVAVLVVLVAAALCFAFGTFRGSWRVWLVGYALTVVALALAFGGVRSARRAATPPPGSAPTSASAPAAGRAGGARSPASFRAVAPREPRP